MVNGKAKTAVFLFIVIAMLTGCQPKRDFSYGLLQLNGINLKNNVSMDTFPTSVLKSDSLLKELNELKNLNVDFDQGAFSKLLDYRINYVEAGKLYLQGMSYGTRGTTDTGFGCKERPFVIESSTYRNNSAYKGFIAVAQLKDFIQMYPEEAGKANITIKQPLFLNATFVKMAEEARKDRRAINNFCPQNRTLEIYREDFKKKTNLSEDYINNLQYEEAVKIYKKLQGLG